MGIMLACAGCEEFSSRDDELNKVKELGEAEPSREGSVIVDDKNGKEGAGVLSSRSLYVAPDAALGGDGSKEAPFSTIEAALAAVKADGRAAGTTIYLRNGIYRISKGLLFTEVFSGTEPAPFTIQAVEAGKAILTGALEIPSERFQPLRNPSRKNLLRGQAKAEVRVADLNGLSLAESFSDAYARFMVCSNGHNLMQARWPNKGFAHMGEILDGGAVYTEERTLGARPKASLENPIGAIFKVREQWQGDWSAELALGMAHPKVYGFFYYDWHFESSTLAKINPELSLQLAGSTRYGIGGHEKIPRRCFVSGLLSELDQPGEWFFDPKMKHLYLWPIARGAGIEISGSGKLVHFKDVSHIALKGLVLEGAKEGVLVEGGKNVVVAGCTLRSLSQYGIYLSGGQGHRVQSCDIYNVGVPIEARGTKPMDYKWDLTVNPPKIISDAYVITNNHIYNCRSYRGVRLEGVGILFSHNLVHDLPGHAVYWGGNDNIFEFNEYYNLLKELGDGGVTYTGAQWHSHGNEQRFNFTHHIFSLPGAHPVNGFYIDDLDQGDRIHGNVFFKVGYRSIIFNGGSAVEATNNIFISNYINVYQTGKWGPGYKEKRPLYDAGHLKRGDKTDLWWRTEQVVGLAGWAHPPWNKAYPQFRRAMETDPYAPFFTLIAKNYEMLTGKDAIWLREVPEGSVDFEPMLPIQADAFVNPYVMNFAFKPEFEPAPGFERIPFEKIGLVVDEFRTHPPKKAQYRTTVRLEHLSRVPYDPEAVYNPEMMNDILYREPPYLQLRD